MSGADATTLFPHGAVGDSLDAKMRDAIEQVSAIFDVPDSLVKRVGVPLAVDVDSTSMVGAEETSWDIDVNSYVTEAKVAHYVNLFLGASKPRFVARLQSGKRFEPMIRAKFRAAGIPEDMYFLGLVESGYEPHAYSRSAAVGIWQFMTATARGVGLRVDWWVDERRDPMRSTDAAARFIRDLRNQFGSLYLAAAAYNGGPGRVSRGLKKFDGEMDDVSGEDRFFALAEQDYLRTETKNYVPQLIAAALLGKNPGKYGIILDSVAVFAYDSVTVPASTPIAAVAKAAGVSVHDVQALNPHFLRGVTPPDSPRQQVRVPVGRAEGFESLFASLSALDRQSFVRVSTKKNETIAGVAARHDLSVKQLQWYNRKISMARKGRLTSGQTLLIPSAGVVSAAIDVPDPSIERYGPAPSRSSSGRTTHVVRRGESLSLLAKKYGTSVTTLAKLNGLKKLVIYPGQSIIVRSGTRARSSASRSASSKGSSSRRSTVTRTSTKKTSAKASSARSKISTANASKSKSSNAKKSSSSKTPASAKTSAQR